MYFRCVKALRMWCVRVCARFSGTKLQIRLEQSTSRRFLPQTRRDVRSSSGAAPCCLHVAEGGLEEKWPDTYTGSKYKKTVLLPKCWSLTNNMF